MSKLKRAVAATAAAAGLTLGAFAMAAPASAVAVNYDCGVYGTIAADYSTNGSNWELIADVSKILPDPSIEFTVGDPSSAQWTGGPTVPVTGYVSGGFAVLNGGSASSSAPDTINMWVPSPPAPPPGLMITCHKI